jgi:hypothetical protein
MVVGSNRTKTSELSTPHKIVQAADRRERFALELFDALWQRYRERVTFVRDYEAVVRQAGATFVNDHIAFRTIACQPGCGAVGIHTLSRVFEALGYQAAGCYNFPDKHLGSLHFQHANLGFPKLFISELKLWEMNADVQKIVLRCLKDHRAPLSDRAIFAARRVEELPGREREKLLATLVRCFHQLPWTPPAKKDVVAVNEASQFAAWVLVHGYNVNHFTALINSHGVADLDDIEKTVTRLRGAGVPMKSEIEGAAGSKLRQTATEAVMLDVSVRNGQRKAKMPWTYAYFELAQRGEILDPATGRLVRFEGFLGPQATQLFEMTRVK